MTDSTVKPKNIFLTVKEHNEKNVTIIKQVYNARYLYRKSKLGDKTKMQQLIMLLEILKTTQSLCLVEEVFDEENIIE